MSTSSKLLFPPQEIELKQKLDAHLNAWKEELLKIDSLKGLVDDMVFDGFYPYYTQQKKRILFIGKEALEIAGCNYIDIVHNGIKSNKIGNKTLNQSQFFARMFYITYGIMHNFPELSKVPYASELAKNFAEKDGLSFAFMNISKFSNESEKWQADIPLIYSFLDAQKQLSKNYFIEEIEILNPDLIISMNLLDNGYFERVSTHEACYLEAQKQIGDWVNVGTYNLVIKKRKYPFFNMYHFSRVCDMEEVFYRPLETAFKQYFKN